MAEAPTGNETLSPDDAARILEELLDAQNHAHLLGLALSVKYRDVEAIQATYKQPKDRLLQIIVAFLQQADRPTWRVIIEALRSPVVGLSSLASRVEAAHFPDLTSSRDVVPETTATESAAAAAGDDEVKSKPSTQLTTVSGSVEAVEAEITGLQQRFNSIKELTIGALDKCCVAVVTVVYILTNIPTMQEHRVFLKENHKALRQCEDHLELFGSLNFYWNFLSCDLLDHLITELAKKHKTFHPITTEMELYKRDLHEFRKHTTLDLFCLAEPRPLEEDPPPGFSKIVVKFDWPPTRTLEDVEIFRRRYAQSYNLQTCAMMLNSIKTGSFTVTWFVPVSVVELLREKRALAVFKEFSVTRLEIHTSTEVYVYQTSVQRPQVALTSESPATAISTAGKSRQSSDVDTMSQASSYQRQQSSLFGDIESIPESPSTTPVGLSSQLSTEKSPHLSWSPILTSVPSVPPSSDPKSVQPASAYPTSTQASLHSTSPHSVVPTSPLPTSEKPMSESQPNSRHPQSDLNSIRTFQTPASPLPVSPYPESPQTTSNNPIQESPKSSYPVSPSPESPHPTSGKPVEASPHSSTPYPIPRSPHPTSGEPEVPSKLVTQVLVAQKCSSLQPVPSSTSQMVAESPCVQTGVPVTFSEVREPFLPRDNVTMVPSQFIGAGLYGQVWEAQYNSKQYAVKKYTESLAHDVPQGVPQGLVDLIKLNLKHKNVVTYCGIGFERTQHFVVAMEKEDQNLATFMKMNKNVGPIMKLSILTGVANGMAYLHSKGIVHCDLRPSNVLVTPESTVKISDYGNTRVVPISTACEECCLEDAICRDYFPAEGLEQETQKTSFDAFSFGHLSLYVVLQKQPHPLLWHTYMENGKRIARTEVGRREKFIKEMGEMVRDNVLEPLLPWTKLCLSNKEDERPQLANFVTHVSFH